MLRHLRVGLSSARLAISFVVSRSSFSRSLSAMATSTASDAAAAATTAAADEYITGSCNCGSLKYRAKLPPLYSGFCHCKFCRASSGAPFAAILAFGEAAIEWVESSTMAKYASAPACDRVFCNHCGTNMCNNIKSLKYVSLHMGTIKEGDPKMKPSVHINLESKADYYQLPDDGLPRYQAFPVADAEALKAKTGGEYSKKPDAGDAAASE